MQDDKLNILVTGGAGFIGSHITDAYIERGHKVVVVDNLSTGKRENINPKARFYNLDITDYESLVEVFEYERFNVVNHHAAQIDVRRSVADPYYDAQINILGSLNLLKCAQAYHVERFIFASSGGTIYGECGDEPPTENFPPTPASPYGITKLAVEYYMKFYSETYGLKTISLRYGNVYGPRQDPFGEAGVVAIFTQRMLRDEAVFIYGDGNQVRDFVCIDDVVQANLIALNHSKGTVLNIGTGKTTSVNELFDMLRGITAYTKEPIYKPHRSGELFKSFLDIRKARQEFNWEPKADLMTGLKETVRFFQKD